MKTTVVFLAGILLLSCSVGMELKSPDAPFAVRKIEKHGASKMTLSTDGISFGTKQLSMPGGGYMCFLKNSKTVFTVECRAETVPRTWRPFNRFAKTFSGDKLTGTHEFIISGNEKGRFTQTIRIVDGKAEITLECDPCGSKAFIAPIWAICIPKPFIQGKNFLFDGKEFRIPPAGSWGENANLWINMGAPFVKRLELDDFSISFPEKTGIIVFRSGAGIQIRFRRPENRVTFFLDMGKTEPVSPADSIVAGINFTRNNDFSVPVYNPDGNLLMNPSFLSGMRYIRTPEQTEPDSLLCRTESRFGSYSAKPGFTLFTVPILENVPYTFSFYAKSVDGKNGHITISGKSYIHFRTPAGRYEVAGPEWQRFEYTFRQPSTAVSLTVGGSRNLVLDGLQLEKGNRATAYHGPPFGLEIKTDSPHGQLVEYGTPFNARLVLRGPERAKGKLEIEITDFFNRKIFEKTFDFMIPQTGECVLKLLEDEKYPRGVNVVRVKVIPDKGRAYTDFLRLSVMKFADNTKKNKDLHAAAWVAQWSSITRLPPRHLELMMKCAIGAVEYADRRAWLGLQDHLSPEAEALYRKYRIRNLGHYLTDTILKKVDGKNRRIPVIGTVELVSGRFCWNEVKPDGWPDSFFQMVEEECHKLAKAHPEVVYWNTSSEPDATEMLRQGRYEEYAKFMLACRRGVKRANPANQYRGAGACNMGAAGQQSVVELLSAARKIDPSVTFDAVDIHPYRPFPEKPDAETDFLLFKERLRRIGYGNVKINLGEGAYFYPLIVSQWLDISPWASTTGSKDKYFRLLLPSYDLGWGERVGTAMLMRYWLFAYKYRNDLISAATWCPLLLDNTHPFAWMLMSSALNDVLGNADYRRDVRFYPGARSYLFEDGEGRAVAAVWYFEEELDRGMKNALRMEFVPRGLKTVEFIDMMGNSVEARREKGTYILPLSNYPFFIRTEKGSLNALAAALENIAVNAADRLPFQFFLDITPSGGGQITAVNLLSRPRKVFLAAGGSPERELELPPQASRSFPVNLSAPVTASGVTELSVPVSIRTGKRTVTKHFKTEVLAVKYAGETFDWKNIPEIPIAYYSSSKPENTEKPAFYRNDGAKDFSAKMQIAWNESALFLRIAVRDDKLVTDPGIANSPLHGYASDGVQIFFDNSGDGKNKAASGSFGFDENDSSYELLPTGENSAIVYRRHAPDTQLTGGVHDCLLPHTVEKNVKCTFSYRNGIRIYEVVFPARYLMPMRLKAGSTPGIGIVIFDRDSLEIPEKQTLRLNRIHPFQRPDAFTTLLLESR